MRSFFPEFHDNTSSEYWLVPPENISYDKTYRTSLTDDPLSKFSLKYTVQGSVGCTRSVITKCKPIKTSTVKIEKLCDIYIYI
jgi:hypothetical protein